MTNSTNRVINNILLGLIFLLFGIVMLGLYYIKSSDYKDKKENFVEVEGKVIDNIESDESIPNDGKYEKMYTEVIEYNVKGNMYKFIPKTKSNRARRIGSRVKLLYNPKNPSEVIFSNNIHTYIILIVGIIFIVLSFYSFILIFFQKKENSSNYEKDNNLYQIPTDDTKNLLLHNSNKDVNDNVENKNPDIKPQKVSGFDNKSENNDMNDLTSLYNSSENDANKK